MKHSAWQTLMGILLLFIVCVVSWEAGTLAAVENRQADMREEKPLVVIDAGHGGFDPGKVGIDGQLEKDINLSIAKKLKAYLEASDVNVVMTRDTDTGLYQSGDSHKKVSDMRRRCDIINEARPDLVVSIHQNSYHQEEINGGQVFYYKTSQNGKRLAEILQERFDYVLGEANRRVAKANDNYYLLLHVKEPIVIVECGFLSNRKEAKALESEDYQDRMAWTIHMGVMEYLNTDEKQSK
ncbi:N-acetylmuramoyl-L-alanine amidase [Clostridium sp. AF18-27]|uniref:N-acetylmuramoyl-L-alanine amidase n=1 Tax=Enterocloster lavalensis TaxID=460384 RepID=A0A1I0GUM0_9FIRM|nr:MULTISPECIES: N-acetylmuramoyl-L-alanine amidase [Enterocloster]MBS5606268.1 N-acetylmuramoyl-L-alanine amidase [Enterocloster asparagiformis]RHR56275.1 N-acetylmuramoyl-L-alanine amidase [Clostridium sp. AF18-27]MCB6341326.1 N-acetylmuramoyl-L-alanine amidase [Enterocloster lavalensis]MDR3759251.1 N-acetylmuramoyl-L-alanine amidase [Enterocloster sp.]PST30687.1 N-acetylmuramoyl-L-alanine amidase [Enterocloster lavalensis]